MTQTEDTISMLKQLVKHLEAGHEVMNSRAARLLGEPLSTTLYSPEFSSVVEIRIEYKRTTRND